MISAVRLHWRLVLHPVWAWQQRAHLRMLARLLRSLTSDPMFLAPRPKSLLQRVIA